MSSLDDNFGPTKGGIASFDAFPKTKATYLQKSSNGGAWTLLLLLTGGWLILTESVRWYTGDTTHTFSVEKGVSHEMQINIDMVVAMQCADLHINIQDAAGDRILAGEKLKKDMTQWSTWSARREVHQLGAGKQDKPKWEDEEDVHDYLAAAGRKRKFKKTPRLRGKTDACRIYGSLEGNKVQGDFHVTARGHGYMEIGEHLDHSSFNFSHQINELSFGPLYPSLINPLDNTLATTDAHFYKFQYYLSVVPTIYTTSPHLLKSTSAPRQQNTLALPESSHTVYTNQYAVTQQSHVVGEQNIPGVFVKFDIEPITLTIAETSGGFLALLVRLVNVISGVLVAGQWFYQLGDWALEVYGRKGGRGGAGNLGVLTGRKSGDYGQSRYPEDKKYEYGYSQNGQQGDYMTAGNGGYGFTTPADQANMQNVPSASPYAGTPGAQSTAAAAYGGYGYAAPEKRRTD